MPSSATQIRSLGAGRLAAMRVEMLTATAIGSGRQALQLRRGSPIRGMFGEIVVNDEFV
jgi:hypothetical protein